MAATRAAQLTPSRDELERLDDKAWRRYGDIANLPDATEDERQQAFDEAHASLLMLLDYDRATRGL